MEGTLVASTIRQRKVVSNVISNVTSSFTDNVEDKVCRRFCDRQKPVGYDAKV